MNTALAILLGVGPFVLIAVAALALGFGPAIVTLLANSRIARGAAIAGAVAWGLFVAATRIRAAGRQEGHAEVEAVNAAARTDRERIEAEVTRLPADSVTQELSEWSR